MSQNHMSSPEQNSLDSLSVWDSPRTPPPVLVGNSRRSLRATLAEGVQVQASCYAFCRYRASLRLAAKPARELGLTRRRRAVVVARAFDELNADETRVIPMAFTTKAKRRLARADRVKLQLDATVRSVRGNSSLRRAIWLRSPR